MAVFLTFRLYFFTVLVRFNLVFTEHVIVFNDIQKARFWSHLTRLYAHIFSLIIIVIVCIIPWFNIKKIFTCYVKTYVFLGAWFIVIFCYFCSCIIALIVLSKTFRGLQKSVKSLPLVESLHPNVFECLLYFHPLSHSAIVR